MLTKQIKVYVDLDGTICGESKWKGFWYNTKKLFTTGLLMEIPKRNWNVLTARPKIDRFIIDLACSKYKLYPDNIFTSRRWFYEFKNDLEVSSWKSSFLSRVICEESLFVNKVIYCDSDPNILSNITPHPDLILCSPTILIETIKELEAEYGLLNK